MGIMSNFSAQLTMEGSIIDFIEVLSDFREVELPLGLLGFLSSFWSFIDAFELDRPAPRDVLEPCMHIGNKAWWSMLSLVTYGGELTMEGRIDACIEFLRDFSEVALPVGLFVMTFNQVMKAHSNA